ncbi:MAG TPA: hypothetical protein VIQ03_09695, partial [Gammaproteobacteria bacterium]
MKFVLFICMYIIALPIEASWQEEVIHENNNFLLSSNASISVNGIPHVFYKGRYLYHSYLDNTNWVQEKIDGYLDFGIERTPNSTGEIAAAVGPDNKLHVVYRSNLDHLKYAVWSGGAWIVTETPLVVGRAGKGVGDIKVDTQGVLHVIYISQEANQAGDITDYLEHATFNGESWSRQAIDTSISPSK